MTFFVLMIRKLLVILFIIFIHFKSSAQESNTYFSGIIKYHNLPIRNVHILNINTGFGEISNSDGSFKILVKENDVLRVSHIEYEEINITVTKIIIKNGITIELKKVINKLTEVLIRNHDLTGSLLTDSKSTINDRITIKHDLIEDMIALAKLPSKYDQVINFESPHLHDVNPIKMNMPAVTGGIPIRDKENELRRELREKKSTPDLIIYDLGKYFFIKELNIPEEKIHHFLTYCNFRNIFELYKKKKIIRLIEILKIESVSYNKIEK